MKIISLLIMATTLQNNEMVLFDFKTPATSGKWYDVNDGVMGGLSQSLLVVNNNGTATFSGTVSLENNGGFASVRTPLNNTKTSSYQGITLKLMGDGKTYSFRFRTNGNFDGYSYQFKIETKKKQWTEYQIPFADFTPTFRGRTLINMPKLISEDIAQMGILVADKQVGNFSLVLDWVKLYKQFDKNVPKN